MKSEQSWLARLCAGMRNLTQTAEEQYSEGVQALEGTKTGWQDAARAYRFFMYAASQGHWLAIVKLGLCHEFGIGIEKDCARAFQYYQQAADGKCAAGLCRLGDCYLIGIGVAQDVMQAVRLYQAAADMHDPEAQYGLGICHEKGMGVEKCPEEAFRWYQRAAKNGSAAGQYNLGKCYGLGTGVAVDPVQAVHWFRQAAGQGKDAIDHLLRTQTQWPIADAMCQLGVCYEMGLGVEKDPSHAERWYCEAAHRQHPYACSKYAGYLLATSQEEGGGCEKAEIWVQYAKKFEKISAGTMDRQQSTPSAPRIQQKRGRRQVL
jgi:TPR repeat protein